MKKRETNRGALEMMSQFIVWELHGVRYLGLRTDLDSAFVENMGRLP